MKKQKKWMVPRILEVCYVTCYIENSTVFLYALEDSNEYYEPNDGEMFFNTESAAKQYAEKTMEKYLKKIKEVGPIIQALYDRGDVDLGEYIPGYKDNNEFRKKYDNNCDIICKLRDVIQTGIFNIGNIKVRVKDVSSVVNKNSKVTIILSNGERIETDNKYSIELIRDIFGY